MAPAARTALWLGCEVPLPSEGVTMWSIVSDAPSAITSLLLSSSRSRCGTAPSVAMACMSCTGLCQYKSGDYQVRQELACRVPAYHPGASIAVHECWGAIQPFSPKEPALHAHSRTKFSDTITQVAYPKDLLQSPSDYLRLLQQAAVKPRERLRQGHSPPCLPGYAPGTTALPASCRTRGTCVSPPMANKHCTIPKRHS